MREKGLIVLAIACPNRPGLEVDLFAREPFDFAEVQARAVRVALDTTQAVVIGLDDLLVLKRAAGRPTDRADVEALTAIRDRTQEPP